MDLHFETIGEVGKKLRSKQLSCLDLTELMLQRIETWNGKLNAFVTVTPDLAREQAKQADEGLAKGLDRGPLHGIPVGVKDLFMTKGVRTTCGSKLYENWIPDTDAAAVTRLREAGCVMLGKTGMHELAYGHSSINPFFGAIGNPWAIDHDPGGSSGGSASAVSAGLAYAALGTDTGCSIRQPAHCCGIVGHKPTFGLVSKAGAMPLVWSMDHVGPLTRTVKDAALVLQAIAGFDREDHYSAKTDRFELERMEPRSVEGLQIGVIRRFFFDGYPEVIEVVEAALAGLQDAGAELVELDVPDLQEAFDATKIMFVESLAIHHRNFEEHPEAFSEEVRQKLDGTKKVSAIRYAEAFEFRREFTTRMEDLMSGVDILAAPTATITSMPIADRPDDYGINAWKNTGIFDFTGQPSISLPCGLTKSGLPVGLMLTGCRFGDVKLLGVAAAVEDHMQEYSPPPGF